MTPTVFYPPPETDPARAEPQTRYFCAVIHKPAGNGDPIPYLAAIYRGELVEALWRGTESEAENELAEFLNRAGAVE